MPWDFALILTALGVLIPWLGQQRIREILARPSLGSRDRLAIYFSTMLFQWLAATVVFWRCRTRELSAQQLALAIPDPRTTALCTLALTAIILAGQSYNLRRLAALPAEQQGLIGEISRKLLPQSRLEFSVFLPLVFTVALCEEFLYRGFVYAALDPLFGALAAAGASSLLFGLAHLYQGRRGVAVTAAIGLLLAFAREVSGSLLPSVCAHFAADLLAGYAVLRRASKSAV